MLAAMTRRGDGLDREAAEGKAFAVGQDGVRRIGPVVRKTSGPLSSFGWKEGGPTMRAPVASRRVVSEGAVITVGVGDKDRLDPLVRGRRQDRSEVARVGGARIDDGDSALADDVGAGPVEGESGGVRRDETPSPSRKVLSVPAAAAAANRRRVRCALVRHSPGSFSALNGCVRPWSPCHDRPGPGKTRSQPSDDLSGDIMADALNPPLVTALWPARGYSRLARDGALALRRRARARAFGKGSGPLLPGADDPADARRAGAWRGLWRAARDGDDPPLSRRRPFRTAGLRRRLRGPAYMSGPTGGYLAGFLAAPRWSAFSPSEAGIAPGRS